MSRELNSTPERVRPRGWLRHYVGLLTPAGVVAGQAALERNRAQRVGRVVAGAKEGLAQRRRATRPRMRALIASPGGKLGWVSVPSPPPPGPLEAIVRPIAVATCDMDPVIASGASPFPLPLHMGHECVAEVLAVGTDVAGVRPGERVVVPFQISCGTCPACACGRTSNCTGLPPISMYGFGLAGGLWGGALADELAVPFADAMLVSLPDSIDPAAAASVADNVVDAYRHIAPHLQSLRAGDRDPSVLVLGALKENSPFSASMPIYTALIATALGAGRVTIVEARRFARAHAERLGLHAIAPEELDDERAPLVVDVSASRGGLDLAVRHTADDGVCSCGGGLHRTARIPFLLAYGHNVTISISRVHARALIPEVLELMSAGRLHPEQVTSTLAPIDEAPRVLREHYLAGAVKTILTA